MDLEGVMEKENLGGGSFEASLFATLAINAEGRVSKILRGLVLIVSLGSSREAEGGEPAMKDLYFLSISPSTTSIPSTKERSSTSPG
ncbi:hypothetical protein PMAYCL1PPCAC_29681 [Pristionchus mayeri]|uniref:Uncharacterized protein n=1 Tax=Pristionchus mayeri TaxID=1317129 RepID=A0AAN5DAK5_9BILA|nr:hypothetical protein PMAYCL1PPCAC_29681 [Pristionchus mayeri]